MTRIQGDFWIDRMGLTDGDQFEIFTELCQGLTAKQIYNGYKRFLDSDEKYLDAKKFRNFCLQKDEHSTNWQAYKILPRSNRIEDQTAKEKSKDSRSKFINEIRENLK